MACSRRVCVRVYRVAARDGAWVVDVRATEAKVSLKVPFFPRESPKAGRLRDSI
jgi:hypothetical protein